ncbi:hypothetical protein AVEN_160809-1, partial [Araneus ventricosus]
VKNILEDAAGTVRRAEAQAKDANARADVLLKRLDEDLIPKFESIRAGTVGGLENLTRIIQQARDDTREASRLADSADAKARRVRKLHDMTKLNLKELKDKILLARQKASSVCNLQNSSLQVFALSPLFNLTCFERIAYSE